MMWYPDMVERMLDLLEVSSRDLSHSPYNHYYVPHWLGVVLVYGQLFGMGALGLIGALWSLFKLKSGAPGLLFLVLFTLILPFPYGFLTGFIIDFSSKCGGGMAYVWGGPFCALPGTLPAWLIFLVVWVACLIRKRRKLKQTLPPLP